MRDRQTRDEIAAVVIAVTCLILISSVFALVGYGFCYEQWKEEAIRHGAAVYVGPCSARSSSNSASAPIACWGRSSACMASTPLFLVDASQLGSDVLNVGIGINTRMSCTTYRLKPT
jgi:hypothetical protein